METPKAEPTVVVDVVANEVVEDESSSSAAAPDPEEAGSSYSASDEDPPAVESGKQSDLNVSTCDIPLPEKANNDDPDPSYTCICIVEPAKQEEAGPVESNPPEQELPATQPLEEAVSDSKKRSSSDDGSQVAKKAKSQSEEEK